MKLLTSEGGFTLIELITIMTVMAVLSALLIASTQVGNRRQQLRDAAAGYASAARNAESLASSAQAVTDPVTGQPTARKAYGVCITSSEIANNTGCQAPSGAQAADTYQVYARRLVETAPDVKTSLVQRPDQPDIIASFTLPKDYSFAAPDIHLDYLPPVPALYANDDTVDTNGGTDDTELIIKHKDVTLAQCSSGSQQQKADCQTIQIKPLAGAVYVQ